MKKEIEKVEVPEKEEVEEIIEELSDLEKVNKKIKATKLKNEKTGKEIGEYVEVNQRVKAFRELYPTGQIITEIIKLENGVCIMKATIYDQMGLLLSTGTAYEKENSTFINKTSYIENCETSAVGRALGFLGIGIDASVASKEEVINAIVNQEEEPKKEILATAKQCEMIKNLFANNVEELKEILKTLNKTKIAELTIKEASDIISSKK